MAVSRGQFSDITRTIKDPSIELLCCWISPEVLIKGYEICCIYHEIWDVEEAGIFGSECESVSSECEAEGGNCLSY
jgi:hypothetical protein